MLGEDGLRIMTQLVKKCKKMENGPRISLKLQCLKKEAKSSKIHRTISVIAPRAKM